MKNLITISIVIFLAAASFRARATIIIAPHTVSFVGISDGVAHPNNTHFTVNDDDMEWGSPAPLPAPVPEPSTITLLVASAFAFCLLKDRLRMQ